MRAWMKRLKSRGWVLGTGLWLLCLAIGITALMRYAGNPGEAARAEQRWPAQSLISFPTARQAALIVFLHPRCPCSRATLAELERLLPALKGKVAVSTVFVRTARQTEEWSHDDLWKKAGILPGVQRVADTVNGPSAAFGARTSGQTFLYDSDGILRFSGGITASRGHEGESVGQASIRAWLSDPGRAVASAPVFGCALSSRSSRDH